MVRRRVIKFTALFVVAFICLNAAGAMCVAYCQTFDITAEPDHCPLKKLSNHCDKANENGLSATVTSIGTNEIDCCPMTVSFFAGPIEKNPFCFDSPADAVAPSIEFSEPNFSFSERFTTNFNYRGPPPIDRRVNRIKHCIIRI